jgi:hypothetical protein
MEFGRGQDTCLSEPSCHTSDTGSRLLDSPIFGVELALPAENIRDVIRFQFYDGMLVRSIPTVPKIVAGEVNFILFRKEGVNAGKLSFKNLDGLELRAVCRERTKSLLDVTIQGLGDAEKCVLLITDGEFEFSLTVLKENENG